MSETEYQTTAVAGELAIRAAGDDEAADGRTIEGLAVPYGRAADSPTAEYGNAPESFAPGSFAGVISERGDRPVPIIDGHHGPVVGTASIFEAADGLRFRGRLLGTPRAAEYAERVAAGVDGVSIEFLPGKVTKRAGGIVHTAVRALGAIAGVYAPAYTAASAAIREADTMATDTTTTEATATATDDAIRGAVSAAIGELGRELRESIATMRPAAPVDGWAALRGASFGELLRREALGDTEVRGFMARALADADTESSPGVTTPGVVGEVRGIFTRGRPAIDSFGRSQLTGSGMSVEWPYLAPGTDWATIIAEQVTQKTEIQSVEVPILKGSSGIKTYAGGSDVSYQLIRRSDPSYLEAYGRILATAYANVTEAAFINIIEGTGGLGSVTIDWSTATAAEIMEAIFLASTQVADATGEPAAFAIASASPYVAIAGAIGALAVPVAPADMNARTLVLNVAGLPIYYSPAVNAGAVLISNGLAAEWHEDGPFTATEEDVARLGRNVATWGLGAAEVALPSGIIVAKAA